MKCGEGVAALTPSCGGETSSMRCWRIRLRGRRVMFTAEMVPLMLTIMLSPQYLCCMKSVVSDFKDNQNGRMTAASAYHYRRIGQPAKIKH